MAGQAGKDCGGAGLRCHHPSAGQAHSPMGQTPCFLSCIRRLLSSQKSEPLSLCWVCSCAGRGEGEGLRQRRREPLSGALS